MARRRGTKCCSLLVLFLTCLSSCSGSSPLLAWSNTKVFSGVTSDDVSSNTYMFLNTVSRDLSKLDFILIFVSEELNFDDIARYGGLYGDAAGQPLSPIKVAMETAGSSVWGDVEDFDSFVTDVSLFVSAYPHYLISQTAIPSRFSKFSSLQLMIVELSDDGNDRESSLSDHGQVIDGVMKRMSALDAQYTAFYMAASHKENREKRAASNHIHRAIFSASNNNASNSTIQECNSTAILYSRNNTLNVTQFCSLLCIRATERKYGNGTGNNTMIDPLVAVYWPSWVSQLSNNRNDTQYSSSYFCNMTRLKFDDTTGSCSSSSLQEHYLDALNKTSSSIKAYMFGSCGIANESRDTFTEIILEVEFIFISGGNNEKADPNFFVPLPGNHNLLPGYWTMLVGVREVNNTNTSFSFDGYYDDDGAMENKTSYLSRYRTQLDLSKRNGSDSPLVEKRGLFYPFSIPYFTSYSCVSHKDHLWEMAGNPNRFIPSQLPLNASDGSQPENVTDGPVLQFVGFQVQAFGIVYGQPKPNSNTTLLAFSPVYDCEGFFDISSWMGTVVVIIVTVVMYFAVLALFSTQVVDRFDDPRGRTITVENLH